MALLTADFETGTNGSTIATTDAGSANAFDAVATTASATRVYANSPTPAHGTLAGSFGTGATAGASSVKWTTSLTGSAAAGPFYARAYCNFPSFTKQPLPISFMSGATNNRVGIRITLSGTMAVLIGGVTVVDHTLTSTLPTSTWVRIELSATGDATAGAYEIRYYATADATTATESWGPITGLNTGGTIDTIAFGNTQVLASVPAFGMDDLGASTTGFMGPSVNVVAASGFFGS